MAQLIPPQAAASTAVPPFRIVLPPGWRDVPATRETLAGIRAEVSSAMRAAHRPDVDLQMRSLLAQAGSRLDQGEVLRLYVQSGVEPARRLPLSLSVGRVRGRDGASLDPDVAALVREHGASPLDPRARAMRWVRRATAQVPGGAVTTTSVNYLIAIPGTSRREALLFSAVIPTSAGESLDDDQVTRLTDLADAIIATFEWAGS